MNPVQKRESLLIEIYNEYHPNCDAFSLKKSKRKDRASRLLRELRNRYNLNKAVFTPYFMGNVTPEMASGNGKYSLD